MIPMFQLNDRLHGPQESPTDETARIFYSYFIIMELEKKSIIIICCYHVAVLFEPLARPGNLGPPQMTTHKG